MNALNNELKSFIDENGKIRSWPKKKQKKELVLQYMSTKFEFDHIYKEKEVNDIIIQWHLFQDLFILRRGMIELNLLKRSTDGAQYWRPKV